MVVPEGTSQFWILNTLNASNRSCMLHPSLGSGKLLNIDMSMLNTAGPRNASRPRLPKEPDGTANAHALNQVPELPTTSAALPPCESVVRHPASGLAATGPAWNGSAITFGRP